MTDVKEGDHRGLKLINNDDSEWIARVLVVDDEIDIAESIQTILSPDMVKRRDPKIVSSRSLIKQDESTNDDLGSLLFDVTVVTSAEEAIEAVRQSHIDGRPYALGFFDVVLGSRMDGFDLVKEIQAIDQQIYSVFVTAYNDRSIDSIDQYLGHDMVVRWDYMNKPFTEGEILQKARNFVSLWNLEREKKVYQERISEIQSKVLEAERANSVAAVSRGMGHEFGNILMQIMGKADLSRNRGTEEMRGALDLIVDACQRASDILDRFKDISGESGGESLRNMTTFSGILEESIALLGHQFRANNIEIVLLEIDDEVQAFVNSTAILQVLVNLSINAMHAMEGLDGKIEFSIKDRGEMAEIVLRDFGKGIPEELLEKVTQPFFTTKGESGTGLGLSISREIIEIEHQGEFTIRNHEDGGLEITLSLPKVPVGEVQSA